MSIVFFVIAVIIGYVWGMSSEKSIYRRFKMTLVHHKEKSKSLYYDTFYFATVEQVNQFQRYVPKHILKTATLAEKGKLVLGWEGK